MIKIIANYLPQFHVIPENNKWWGEGYTEWTAVKQARPQFIGHEQPHIPLGQNYYFLDDPKVLQWQANLARKYSVYGFGIYHYWFSSNLQLLQKPAELILHNREIDINFMFIWDNTSWMNTWTICRPNNKGVSEFYEQAKDGEKTELLAKLEYGTEEDWKKHFEYLLPFFKDERYIKISNKPLFAFFQPQNNFLLIKRMVAYWEELAIENGFSGIICLSRDHVRNQHLPYRLRYSPFSPNSVFDGIKNRLANAWAKNRHKMRIVDYDKYWRNLLTDARNAKRNTFLSGFVSFDDTPRRGDMARVIRGASPEKFKKYMTELLNISKMQGKEYVFLTAWNEWGEGAYLEPDVKNEYAYLEALNEAVKSINLE